MLTAAVVTFLVALLADIGLGIFTVSEAIAALLEVGIIYTGAATLPAISAFISNLIAQNPGGGIPVAATVSAVAPIPVIAQPPACSTPKPGHKGICCAAITQLGLTRASQGFQYVSCTGKTVCLACGTKASTSVKHLGQTVFSVKRVSCGPSGCPALATIQGQVVPPI